MISAIDRTILNFDQLGLTPALLRAVGDMGLYAPTPIQAEAIPAVLKSADVWATAPTGSGKTLAFALPLLQHLLAAPRQTNFRRPVRTLVLVPTRELAVQVAEEVAKLAFFKRGLRELPVYGGQSYERQFRGLDAGAQVVTVTAEPGSGKVKLDLEKTATGFVSKTALPAGEPYRVVVQTRASADAKPKNFRVDLNLEMCGECKKKEYACTCAHGDEAKK